MAKLMGVVMGVALVASGMLVAPVAGADEETERPALSEEERRQVVNDLEHGVRALRKLGKAELAEHLIEIAKDVARGGRGQAKRHNREREMVERHIEIIKVGVPILIEAGRRDSAELLEQAAHARELLLEGRKDKEALRIRETAPNHAQLTELLMFAADHATKQGKAKQAGWLTELGQHYKQLWQRKQSKRKSIAERIPVPDTDVALLRKAVEGLLEAGKRDRAHRVEQALHWRRLRAEGQTGEDAQEVRRRAPAPAELARHLRFAADLWMEFGHAPMREALDAFAARLEKAGPGR